jgi:A/G-specific adenine glycosylase
VCEQHDGRIPDEPVAFRALPGVGDYICAAVQSIAFGVPLAVVDGNVKRVLARLLELEEPVNHLSAKKTFQEAADRLLDVDVPGTFNQAVMELGALVCTPTRPACGDCPLRDSCKAHRSSRQHELPRRIERRPAPTWSVAVAVVENDGLLLITRRPTDGLLGGLWEFPGGKIKAGETAGEACAREILEETGLTVEVGDRIARVKHAYTHFKVELEVFRCRYRGGDVVLDGPADYRWIALGDIGEYPLPKASHKILPHLETRACKK